MSEERDKRDGGATGSTDPSPVEDSAADASSRAEAPSDHAPEGEVAADESPASAAPAGKPTGKRSARRAGTPESAEPAKPVQMAKTAKAATSVKSPEAKSRKADKPQTENIFKRIRRFLREVFAELRKVIWPNRKQMITYTSVVLVFVTFMVTFISLLDLGFIKGVSWLFG
ncbi:preprotein translocase subunit SecE [Prescottella defluvii]|uniref:preprotein translocase subunit SecE n=1 Tax=Prescottella defluvii TaxID=1323361 RepID=UPI0004F35C29|nr:preprotein translocase subunit SecE [Prescottella defluvii]